jgi:hypothetical protein
MSERDPSDRNYGSRSPPRTERHERYDRADRLQERAEPSRGQNTERLHLDSPTRHDV